jgi:hypothetical protein
MEREIPVRITPTHNSIKVNPFFIDMAEPSLTEIKAVYVL